MSLGFQELRCLKKITVNQTDETLHGAKKKRILLIPILNQVNI